MLRGIWGDEERFRQTYWSRWKDIYFPADGARRDEDGFFWIMGRVDDVLNVSGHRLGAAEVESALVEHEAVAEAAVVGRPHEIKGEGIAAFCVLRESAKRREGLVAELKAHVASAIGAIARPDDIVFAADVPKTRSGKIMRRLLRDIAAGKAIGDTTTLADPAVVEKLREEYDDEGLNGPESRRSGWTPGRAPAGEATCWRTSSPTDWTSRLPGPRRPGRPSSSRTRSGSSRTRR